MNARYSKLSQIALLILVFGGSLNCLAETEPNNTVDDADPLASGAVINGQLSSKADQDWFAFGTKGPEEVSLSFKHARVGYQFNLYQFSAYDEQQNLLASTGIYAADSHHDRCPAT